MFIASAHPTILYIKNLQIKELKEESYKLLVISKKEQYEKFSDNKVSFITFNYDRSLEGFLHESLVNHFSEIVYTDILKVLKKLKIIHIYGQIAKFNWQQDNNSEEEIPYKKYNYKNIEKLIDNIKIINEAEDSPEIKEAHEEIKKAQRIFFLGFGYRPENLKILNLPGPPNNSQIFYSTALDLYQEEIERIKVIFKKGSNFNIFDMDNLELLRRYL